MPGKKIVVFLLCGLIAAITAQDFGVPSRSIIGVGTRAFALGNNYVALSDDASAIFWNPAGLAFTPAREFQAALNGFSHNLESEYQLNTAPTKSTADRQRVRPNIIALLRAIPTRRGGFSLAFGFQNPYVMDDIVKYKAVYPSGDWDEINYYSFGQLNLWTAAFGMQVAPDFGVGAAVSLITGRNILKYGIEEYLSSGNMVAEINYKIHQSYLGAELRLGLLYSLFDRMKFGIRLELPQFILFDEELQFDSTTYDSTFEDKWPDNGRLKTAITGAVGVSYRFPFMLLSGEFRTRAPIPDAEEESMYSYWKVGAGAGVEIPLFIKSLLLRAGYAWQEFDRYPMLIVYDDTDIETDATIDVIKDEHLITTGLSFMTRHGLSFDLSYGYKFWEIDSYPLSGGVMNEIHKSHYFMGSFALRY